MTRKALLASAIVGLSVFAAVAAVREIGALQFLELRAYDWQLSALSAPSRTVSPVVLVTMSEEDISALGRWPLADSQLADLLERIDAAGARVVGLDIYRDVAVPPGTERLAQLLESRDNVVAVMKFPDEQGRGVPAPAALRGSNRVGFNDIVPDADGVVRRALIFLDDGADTAWSFALRLALRYLAAEGVSPAEDPQNPQMLRLGRTTIPPFESNDGAYVRADSRGYQFLVDYARDSRSLERFTMSQVMSGAVNPARLRDRIVVVGVAAISVKDEFRIPRGFAGTSAPPTIPGVALHGIIADQLVRAALDGEATIRSWSDLQEYSWILVWCLLGSAAGLIVRSAGHLVLLGLVGALVIAGSSWMLLAARIWIPVVAPLAGGLVALAAMSGYRIHSERQERETLMRLFSKHVSPEVADVIWQHRAELTRGGHLKAQHLRATVLFLDFAGFTAAAEALGPQRLMTWLGSATDRMSREVMRHAGVVDDYFGDGIKANFGVPLPRNTDAEVAADALAAVQCALAMRDALADLNASWRREGLPEAALRIGIATGDVVAGSVGSSDRMKYTTVGDTVNVAARLEAFDRESAIAAADSGTRCRILASEATYRLIESSIAAEPLGALTVKGKEGAVRAFRILGPKRHANEEQGIAP